MQLVIVNSSGGTQWESGDNRFVMVCFASVDGIHEHLLIVLPVLPEPCGLVAGIWSHGKAVS